MHKSSTGVHLHEMFEVSSKPQIRRHICPNEWHTCQGNQQHSLEVRVP
jgi:hypothetical protein